MGTGGLAVERYGTRGPALFLVHGWGLHGGIWDAVAGRLATWSRLTAVDLPGYGRSAAVRGGSDLETMARMAAGAAPAGAVWVGWSLGALVSLCAVLGGADVRGLVLVGATPRFTAGEAWPHAVAPEVLEGFRASLQTDYRATLNRFLALQSRGSSRARDELRSLRERLYARGEPSPAALAAGLEILSGSDLRGRLGDIACPALWVHGERDTLAPAAAARVSAERMPNATVRTVSGAGHAPFISHPEAFCTAVKEFCDG